MDVGLVAVIQNKVNQVGVTKTRSIMKSCGGRVAKSRYGVVDSGGIGLQHGDGRASVLEQPTD